ncbi:hypothetical protein [Flavobacterium sp. N2038]|uniref:hypothetical protein n=1 Tax=Flavobacterium sp. N2038 TaxID=2986829 RepID=UPI002225910D|nr:hypothetical protein [Flavobacterium sp. N2038]
MKKTTTMLLVVLVIFILLIIEKCSLNNLSTADFFRPKAYKNFKGLQDRVQSSDYEIVPVTGDFPILFDSIKNEFYIANKRGLTKIDANGNVMFSADLQNEKYTSVFDFANFSPYVFAEKGVYDFSGDQLEYCVFSKILNAENEINDLDFKSIFEKYYKEAELVIYDTGRNIDFKRDCVPMYFKVKNQWILLFSQKGDYRFTHQLTLDVDDIIGQIDFENFPAKFSDKRLMVLKDHKNGVYSTKQIGNKIDDKYLDTYYTQILKERKFNYQTSNEFKLLSYKKEAYYYKGNYWDLPEWINPSFICTGYFQLTYNNEKLFFKEKAIKYFLEPKSRYDLYLYELPVHLRKNTKVAFIDYDLDIGGYRNDSTEIIEPIIKNTGLYIIRPKPVR